VNLLYRLIRVVIQSLFRDPIGFFDSSTLTFRVLPNDLDLNMHMTNSRYLSIMDLGRVDLVSRTKMGKSFLTGRWQAMLGAAHIRFRRGLSLFEQYQLITQVSGVFLKRGITVSLTDVLEELGVDDVSLPPLTDALKKWKEADDAFKKSSRSD